MIKVAIITVNYNGKKDTLELLESLERLQVTGYRLQVIVVDNGSSDGSVSIIKKRFPKVDILQTGANLGFSGGYNRGIEYGKIWDADYFLLINNDCLINNPKLLEELIKTAQSEEKIGLVSPKIYFAPGFEFQKKYKESDKGKVIWYGGGYFDWDNIQSVHRGIDEVDNGQYDDIYPTEHVSGACVLITKEIIEKIGLFDEKYFLYFEDADFSKRVTDAGFKKFYNGQVSIYHKVSQSTGTGSEITDYYLTRNRLFFGIKYAKTSTKFALLRESLRLLLFGRKAQRKAIYDFILGVKGAGGITKQSENVQYPLKLSIVTVNYNTSDLVKKLLESIFKKESGFNKDTMEVIVLDNGKLDPCTKFLKEFPQVIYLQNEENEGFSKGYNKTIKLSKGEYILLLNSDTEVLENSLSEILKTVEKFKGNAVLAGRIYFPDLTSQDSCFNLPTIINALKEYIFFQKGAYFMFVPKGEGVTKVEGAAMVAYLIPKKVINKIGLLDEGTFLYFEDVEYARRLKKANIPTFFVPSAKFIHYHGASGKRLKLGEAYKFLQKSGLHYHGKFYYSLLSFVLKVGQKLNWVKTPVAR